MSPSPAQHRVDAALRLAPMTVNALSQCLTLSRTVVRRALDELHSRRRVVRYRTRCRTRRAGAPPYVYERRA